MSHSKEIRGMVGRIEKLHLEAQEICERFDRKYGAPNGKKYERISCKEG